VSAKELGKIGVGSWTFPWATGTVQDRRPESILDPVGVVQRAVDIGVHVVHFLDNLPLDTFEGKVLDRARDLAVEHKIEVEVGTRGTEPAHLRRYLEIAQRMGARLIRTMGGWHKAPAPVDQIKANFRKVLPQFDGAGVRIALENYEAYSTSEIAAIVREVDSPSLGVCLDLTNSFAAMESADEILENLAPFTISVHLKEFTVERLEYLMGFAFRGKPTGQGVLPLRKIFETLLANSRKVNVIVEQWPPFHENLEKTIEMEFEWARQGVEHLAGMGYLTK
jgi:sugar phosphate isomerase/epimerase